MKTVYSQHRLIRSFTQLGAMSAAKQKLTLTTDLAAIIEGENNNKMHFIVDKIPH